MKTHQTGHDLTILANGIAYCYDDLGESTEPVIFIHGFPFDKNMWLPQMEFLKTSRRVIAYDIRGFGKSTDNGTPYSIDLFADDLITLMDTLKIDKAVFCGLSMGGYIALNAIKRFPDRCSGLILADTQCTADTADAKENRYKTIKQTESKGISEFGEGFIKKVFYKSSFESKKDLVNTIKHVVLSNTQKAITGGLTALAERSETCSVLETITIPTLILCGSDDELTPVEKSEALHKGIKGSVLKITDEAGHLSNLEQPGEFNNSLGDFLKDV